MDEGSSAVLKGNVKKIKLHERLNMKNISKKYYIDPQNIKYIQEILYRSTKH